jgi:hypothetical protein
MVLPSFQVSGRLQLIILGNALTDTPEVCFTNLLGASQSNQDDNQGSPPHRISLRG